VPSLCRLFRKSIRKKSFEAGIWELAEVGASAQFGILGGTGDFRKARGEASAVVTAPGISDVTFDLD
jgi:hypothetical protein